MQKKSSPTACSTCKKRSVLERAGHTEASVDISKLAGLNQAQLFGDE